MTGSNERNGVAAVWRHTYTNGQLYDKKDL